MNLQAPQLALLVLVGAIASAINTVAGGGTLISFPILTLVMGIPPLQSNATNSVGLWPGSLSGAFGYANLLPKTASWLKLLTIPTILGSLLGTTLLFLTGEALFSKMVPALLLAAALLLWFQPKVKELVAKHKGEISPLSAAILQFFVAIYGGYFGAGMGIMMLAVFVLVMKNTLHEINAVKNWLGVFINIVASAIFFTKHLVQVDAAMALVVGSLVGGFAAGRLAQKIDGERLRKAIAVYGLVTAAYFAYKHWFVAA